MDPEDEKIYEGIRRAHAAGDEASVRKLAEYLQQREASKTQAAQSDKKHLGDAGYDPTVGPGVEDSAGNLVKAAVGGAAPWGYASAVGAGVGSVVPGVGTAAGAVAAPFAMGLGDLATMGYNAVGHPFMSTEATAPSDQLRNMLANSSFGAVMKTPETPTERILSGGTSAAAQAVTGAGFFKQILGGMAPATAAGAGFSAPGLTAGPVTRNVIAELASKPLVQAAAGGGAGLAANTVNETLPADTPAWLRAIATTGASIAGGGVAGAAADRAANPTPQVKTPLTGVSTSDEHGDKAARFYADAAAAGGRYSKDTAHGLVNQFEQFIHDNDYSLKIPDQIRAFITNAREDIDKTPGRTVTAVMLDGLRSKLGEMTAAGSPVVRTLAGEFRDQINTLLGDENASVSAQRAAVSGSRVRVAEAEKAHADAEAAAAGSVKGPAAPKAEVIDASTFPGASPDAPGIKVFTNPTEQQISRLTIAGAAPARFLQDKEGNLYVWDARADGGTHLNMSKALGIEYDDISAAKAAKAAGIPINEYGYVQYDPATQTLEYPGGSIPPASGPPDPALVKAAADAKANLDATRKAHGKLETAWTKSDPDMAPLRASVLAANGKVAVEQNKLEGAKAGVKEAQAKVDAQQGRIDGLAKPTKGDRDTLKILQKALEDAKLSAKDADAVVKRTQAIADETGATFKAKIEELAPTDPKAIAAAKAQLDKQNTSLTAARKATTDKFNAKALETVAANIETAKQNPNYTGDEAGLIRKEMQKLVKSDQFKNFPPDAQAAIRQMLQRDNTQTMLRFIGSFTPGAKRGGYGVALDALLGVAAAHNPAAILGAGVAPLTREAANYFARQKLAAASNAVDSGRAPPKSPPRNPPPIAQGVASGYTDAARRRNYFAQ